MPASDSPVTRWWWVRHAPVTENRGRMYGQSDPAAEVDQQDRFKALAALLPENAVLITSHLQRTRQTAAAIAEAGLALADALVEPDFAEQSFGKWQGTRYEDVPALAAPHLHRFFFTTAEHVPPGGESFAAVAERVGNAIERHMRSHAGRDIIAVAHGGSIRAALAHALQLDPDGVLSFKIDNLSVTRLDHHGDGPKSRRNWQVIFANHLPLREDAPIS